QTSSGSPIDTQTSVYITSAFLVPSITSSVNVIVQLFSLAITSHFSTNSFAGNNSFGAHAVKFNPILAQATIKELPILFLASPIYTKFTPFNLPNFSSIVNKSANI